MECIGETKKRQKAEGEDQKEKKWSPRRSGGDTEYLREKCKMERNLREKELDQIREPKNSNCRCNK